MKHFKDTEFSDISKMNPQLLDMLDELREAYGRPVHLNSTWRPADHPIEIDKPANAFKTHVHGEAVDISTPSPGAVMLLIRAACEVGFMRIGVSRRSKDKKQWFVHLDIGNYTRDLPISLWTY